MIYRIWSRARISRVRLSKGWMVGRELREGEGGRWYACEGEERWGRGKATRYVQAKVAWMDGSKRGNSTNI